MFDCEEFEKILCFAVFSFKFQRLNLASNQLRRVPSSVVLPCIQEIDLSDNRLTAIPDAIIQALSSSGSSITSLHLNTNPWNCDCHLASLVHWLNGSDTGSAGKRAVCVGTDAFTCPVCYQPPQLRGISLDTLFVPPCDKNATLQSQFPQSWENNEPLTTLTGVVISNSIINNAVISNSVLRNVTSVWLLTFHQKLDYHARCYTDTLHLLYKMHD